MKSMATTLMSIGAAAIGAGMGGGGASAAPAAAVPARAPARTTVEVGARKLFLDVHEIGKGKVKAKEAAGAHQRDLEVQGKYGVDFKAYWVDEKEGRIYCLAEAPSAEALNHAHKEAHGLLARTITEVTADNTTWTPRPGLKLYLDVHHLGAGKVNAKDVAAAHQKDLAVQGNHGVRFLNYWFDEAAGDVMCLAEAPSAEALNHAHKEAHGLLPSAIDEVSEGR